MRRFPGDRVDSVLETLFETEPEFLFHQRFRIALNRLV